MGSKTVYNAQVMFGEETTWGTAVTPTFEVGRLQNATLTVNNNNYRSRGLGGGRKAQNSYFGPLDVSWSLNGELNDPDIFEYIIGQRTGAGTSGDPYDFTTGTVIDDTTGVIPFTMEVAHTDGTDIVDVLDGCVTRSATINIGVGSVPVTFSMEGVARFIDPSQASATSYTDPTKKTFTYHQATFAFGSSPSTLGRVQTGTVTFNNNLITSRSCGSRLIEEPGLGKFEITFSLTLIVDDTYLDALEDALYGAASGPVDANEGAMTASDQLQITITEGTDAGERTFLIDLDDAYLDSMTKPVPLGDQFSLVTVNGYANKGLNDQPIKYYTS